MMGKQIDMSSYYVKVGGQYVRGLFVECSVAGKGEDAEAREKASEHLRARMAKREAYTAIEADYNTKNLGWGDKWFTICTLAAKTIGPSPLEG